MFINMGPPELGIKCSLQECVRLAAETGFAGVDVDMVEAKRLVDEKGSTYVRELFDRSGMKIGGWIWFDHFGFSDDEAAFNEQLSLLPALAETAESIGATRVLSWLLPYSDELNYGQNFKQHVERIRATMRILSDHGQRLALEYIGPKTFRDGHTYAFISTMGQALELIDAVGEANVGLILDSWHWYTSQATLDDITQLPADLAIYVHLSDAPAGIPVDRQLDHVRRLPGSTGVIDNAGFLKTLHEIGYAGPVTAEPFSEEIEALPPREAAQVTAKALSDLWIRSEIS